VFYALTKPSFACWPFARIHWKALSLGICVRRCILSPLGYKNAERADHDATLVPNAATHPSTIGLRNARNLKQLSFLPPRARYGLADFLDWLLRELDWDNPGWPPSSLENLTLILRTQCRVRDVAATYAGTLSDILADEHHYPNLKEVRFALIPDVPRFESTTTQEELATERRHKEEISRAMRALEEKGVLQLQWA
jgi:hypothetical protein